MAKKGQGHKFIITFKHSSKTCQKYLILTKVSPNQVLTCISRCFPKWFQRHVQVAQFPHGPKFLILHDLVRTWHFFQDEYPHVHHVTQTITVVPHHPSVIYSLFNKNVSGHFHFCTALINSTERSTKLNWKCVPPDNVCTCC